MPGRRRATPGQVRAVPGRVRAMPGRRRPGTGVSARDARATTRGTSPSPRDAGEMCPGTLQGRRSYRPKWSAAAQVLERDGVSRTLRRIATWSTPGSDLEADWWSRKERPMARRRRRRNPSMARRRRRQNLPTAHRRRRRAPTRRWWTSTTARSPEPRSTTSHSATTCSAMMGRAYKLAAGIDSPGPGAEVGPRASVRTVPGRRISPVRRALLPVQRPPASGHPNAHEHCALGGSRPPCPRDAHGWRLQGRHAAPQARREDEMGGHLERRQREAPRHRRGSRGGGPRRPVATRNRPRAHACRRNLSRDASWVAP